MAQRRFESSEESEKAEDVAETLSTDDEEAPKTFTVKVDGKETEVTEDELVKAYQIDSAAQKRLQEVTEMRRTVEQERAELEALRQQSVEPKEEDSSHDTDFDVHEYITAIREGEDEEAAKVTEKLVKSLQTTTPVQQIVESVLQERDAQAEAQEVERVKQEAADAEAIFRTTYAAEIESNTDFFALACMEDGKLEADTTWKNKSILDRYLEAGERAKAWTQSTKTTAVRDQKLKQKASIASPNARTTRQVPKIDRPETPSNVVREMAKARGQHLY